MPENKTLRIVTSVSSRSIVRFFAVTAAVFAAAGFIVWFLRFPAGVGHIRGFSFIFDLNAERNLPTWFSASILLICALLFWATANRPSSAGSWRGHWLGLAGIFAYLSLDETSTFHEKLIKPLREALNLSGIFYFSWTLIALIVLAVFFVVYASFIRALSPRMRRGLMLAGGLYIFGALILEMVEGPFAQARGINDGFVLLIAQFEESFEMAGAVLCLKALLEGLELD